MPYYTAENAMTCAIIWEDMLSTLNCDTENEYTDMLKHALASQGTSELRGRALDLAVPMDTAWEATAWLHGEGDPFDWEFVPGVIKFMFDLQGSLDPAGVPMAALLAAFDINQSPTADRPRQEWKHFLRFDSKLVTLFKNDLAGSFYDDADPLNPHAIATCLGLYGRNANGLAGHLLDIDLDEHMAARGKALLAALNRYVGFKTD